MMDVIGESPHSSPIAPFGGTVHEADCRANMLLSEVLPRPDGC